MQQTITKLGVSNEEREIIGLEKKKREEPCHVHFLNLLLLQNPLIDIHHHKKNPNPLSCKKKQSLPPPPKQEAEKKKRRSKKNKAKAIEPLKKIDNE